MKKIFLLLSIILLLVPNMVLGEELNIQSKYVLLMDSDGNVLLDKDSNKKTAIASLTKIMTAIVTIDSVSDLNQEVSIKYVDYDGLIENNLYTSGLQVGEKLTYYDLLYSLILKSGAESAQALARLVGGSNDEFVVLMNKKAKEIGLNDTSFANPVGMDDDNNYSTASDISKLLRYALNNKTFYKIVTTDKYTISNGRITFSGSVRHSVGDYILGGKTGTTDDAGLCLASFADDNGEQLTLVTINAPYDKRGYHNLEDAKEIYEYYINKYERANVVKKDEVLVTIPTKYIKENSIDFVSNEEVNKYLVNEYKKEDLVIKYDGIDEITPFMKEGTLLGSVSVSYLDKVLYTQDIILDRKYPFSILKFIQVHWIILSIILIIIIGVVFILKKKKRRKRKKVNK